MATVSRVALIEGPHESRKKHSIYIMDFPAKLLEMPIAILEEYGLSVRTISMIEYELDAIYFRDLSSITRKEFLETDGLGLITLQGFLTSTKALVEKLEEGK